LIRWWDLKQSIYNGCIIMSLYLAIPHVKILNTVFINFIIGMLLSSIIDRMIFEVRDFNNNDIIMLTINVIYAVYNLIKYKKNVTRD